MKPSYLAPIAVLTAVLAFGSPFMANAQALRDTFQQNYRNAAENLRNNEDYRNAMLKKSGTASSTLDTRSPKVRLIVELVTALDNLKQIRSRIAERIDTETASGSDMRTATSLLVVADSKISSANQDIHVFAESTTSLAMSLDTATDTPRSAAGQAVDAIEAARIALGNVVSAIAQSLGITITTATASSSPQ